jgi:hypothetical protein
MDSKSQLLELLRRHLSQNVLTMATDLISRLPNEDPTLVLDHDSNMVPVPELPESQRLLRTLQLSITLMRQRLHHPYNQ